MSGSGPEVAAWAETHGACFEVEPLMEVVRGRPVQVGFTVSVYARLPVDERPVKERWAEAAEVQARLREVIESLAPPPGGPGRLELEPPRTAAFLAPESGRQPEIAVRARVFHGQDYFAEVTEGEERRVYAGARRLAELRFKERRRRIG